MKKLFGIGFSRFIAEVVLIVLGVLLGLFVNEMRQEHYHKQNMLNSLQQIENEIEKSQQNLANINKHHQAVRDSLASLLSYSLQMDRELTMQDIWQAMPGGFGVPSLQSHAWHLASELGYLQHMEFTTASQLSFVYDLQEFYLSIYDRLGDNFYLASNADPSLRAGMLSALFMLANDAVIHEEDLLKQYSRVIEHLKEVLADNGK